MFLVILCGIPAYGEPRFQHCLLQLADTTWGCTLRVLVFSVLHLWPVRLLISPTPS